MSLDAPQDQAPLTPVPSSAAQAEVPENEEAEVITYLLVTDKTNEVITGGPGPEGLSACRKMANLIRRADGSVTIYRSLKF